MSEADGVDGGAFLQQSLVHLQFSEKPETPKAERHLERESRVESPLARGSPDAATSKRWDLGRLDQLETNHRGIHHHEIKFLQGSF
ncbi:hypothetical protein HZH68_006868 [Vespula germanica]|uniref:Uncharacterized protein n=1 Tax=Vespula germanica TaxID=30212 RepID=A0A834K6C4_VESGE|nr:hypothetical protein HZH68_006868 [Vespula germanica]